ncbi:MAG: hypothetical protein ABH858_00350 [Candidatus Omnitrophota bacterium]
MQLLIFIFIATIIFFYLLFFTLSYLSRNVKTANPYKIKSTYKNRAFAAKLASIFLIVATLSILSFTAISLVNLIRKNGILRQKSILSNISIKDASKSTVSNGQKSHRIFPPRTDGADSLWQLTRDGNRDYTFMPYEAMREERINTPYGESIAKDKKNSSYMERDSSDKGFAPSTIKLLQTMVNDEKSPPPIIARLRGAEAGDFFVTNFYDRFDKGKFVQSPNLVFKHLQRKADITVNVEIILPDFNNNLDIQLPFLLNGCVEPQSFDDKTIILDAGGNLKIKGTTADKVFNYIIKKDNGPSRIYYDQEINSGLIKEFNTIPDKIKQLLNIVKNKSEFVSLAATASIINTYFGYQTGITDVYPQEEETWNAYLGKTLQSNNRLLCDCDVLSTFAFIYLKYLDLHPLFLVGYLNTENIKNALSPTELHAALYVEENKQWLIFDPTLFIEDFSLQIIPKENRQILSGESGKPDYPSTAKNTLNQTYNTVHNTYSSSPIKYFTFLPLMADSDGTPSAETKLAKTIIDLLKPNKNGGKTDSDTYQKKEKILTKTTQSSVILYCLILILAFFLSHIKRRGKNTFPISTVNFYIYHVSTALVLSYIFSRAMGIELSTLWHPGKYLSLAGMILCITASLLSIYLLYETLSAEKDGHSSRYKHIFKKTVLFLPGILLGLAGILYVPTTAVFIAACLIVYTSISGFKKNIIHPI